MPFELFTPEKAVPRGEPMVTITSYGRIAFNKAATHRLEKTGVKFLNVLWNSDTREVGITSAEKSKNSFALSYGTNGNGAAFSCVPFLVYIRYDWEKTRNFEVLWNENSSMYIFTLNEAFLGFDVTGEHLKRAKPRVQDGKDKE